MRSKFQELPNKLGQELVDHVNISPESKSYVGKILDPEFEKPFNYPHIGAFTSVFSLWQWLQHEHNSDSFRGMKPFEIKKVLHEHGNIRTEYVKNFKAVIGYATWIKVKKSKRALEQFKRLPPDTVFVFYKTIQSSPSVRMASKYPIWLSEIAEIILKAILTGEEPDFTNLITEPNQAGLTFLEGFLSDKMPEVHAKISSQQA